MTTMPCRCGLSIDPFITIMPGESLNDTVDSGRSRLGPCWPYPETDM